MPNPYEPPSTLVKPPPDQREPLSLSKRIYLWALLLFGLLAPFIYMEMAFQIWNPKGDAPPPDHWFLHPVMLPLVLVLSLVAVVYYGLSPSSTGARAGSGCAWVLVLVWLSLQAVVLFLSGLMFVGD